ncbi:MFS transporter [Lactiplantibacillus herbarum]|uniref:MFS transporter n=1 Tax=Lactiplantibacillus herbarum TaxID=1670446 RepID=UPI00064EF677|nr:MFS transporter [Lactiplantibacillus herbarum]
MKSLLGNKVFLTLTTVDFFETLGTSLFNIILLTYARSFTQASLLVSIVSVATVLPGVFGFLTGRLADRQRNKRLWLLNLKFIQAGLYLLLAQLITVKQVSFLLVIIGINLGSDIMGILSSSLRMPLIQAKVATTVQEQAVGINQGVSVLMQMVGQTVGVSLLALTGNYQLAGYVNAITFLIAGVVLLVGYPSLKLTIGRQPAMTTRQLWRKLKLALEQGAQMNVLALLTSILLLNAVGASVDAILNLYLIDRGSTLPIPFSVAVLVMNTMFVIGSVAGNLLHTGWFQKWSFRAVILVTVLVYELMYINLLSWQNYWLVVLIMLIGGFCMGQANPKLMASLLKVADEQIVGSLSGVLNTLATLSIPIGSIGLVLIDNVVSAQAAYVVSMMILAACAGCLWIKHK